MIENAISYEIRGCIFTLYNKHGPGLLESAYEAALAYELKQKGFHVAVQVGLPLNYEEARLEVGYRADIIAENKVLIEVNPLSICLKCIINKSFCLYSICVHLRERFNPMICADPPLRRSACISSALI